MTSWSRRSLPYPCAASASSSYSDDRMPSRPPVPGGRLGQLGRLGRAQGLLDLGVLVEAARLVGQDQVGAHAAAGEVPHAVAVLGPVRMGVEVAHAVPPCVLQQLHHVEGVADALGAEAEVLVELPDPLRVEVDVEELVVPEGLRHGLGEGQAAHGLMGELGVEPHHVGLLQRADEGEGMPDGGQQYVAPGLVRLGFEGDPQIEPAGGDVLADEIDGFFVAVERQADVLGRLGLHAFPPAPQHEDVRPELCPQLGGLAGLLHGEPP